MNSQRNIPCLVDDDFCMNESRAIMGYLSNQYDKDGNLYPKDPKIRARVDQRLYFEMGIFYKAFSDLVYPKLFDVGVVPENGQERFVEVLNWLNDFVKPTGFVAGTDHFTIADIACFATYSTQKACDGFHDFSAYPELNSWCEKMKTLVNHAKYNQEGANEFGRWYKAKF